MRQHDATGRQTLRSRRDTERARRREYRYALLAGICAIWATVATTVAWHVYDDPPGTHESGEIALRQSLAALDRIVVQVADGVEAVAEAAPPALAATMAEIERTFATLGDELEVRDSDRLRRNAETFAALSAAHLSLGEAPRAAAAAAAGRSQLEQLDPATPDDRDRLALAYIIEGDALLANGELEDAAAAYAEASVIRGALSAAAPSNADALRKLSITYEREGQALDALGENGVAGSRFRQSLAIRQQLASSAGNEDPRELQALAVAHSNLGDHANRSGSGEEAVRHYREAMEIFERLAEHQPDETAWQDGRALHLGRIGRAKLAAGEAAGLTALAEATEAYYALIEREPESRRWQSRLAELLIWTGDIRWDRSDLPGARSAYTRALEIRRHHAEREPAKADLAQAYAETLSRLARVDQAEGMEDVARLRIGESIALRRQVLAANPENAISAAELAEALTRGAEIGVEPQANLEEALDVLGRFAEEDGLLVKHKSLADDIRQRLAGFTQ